MTTALVVTRANGDVSAVPMQVSKNPTEWSAADARDVIRETWNALGLPDTVMVEARPGRNGVAVVITSDVLMVQLGPLPIPDDSLHEALNAMGRRLPDMLSD